MTSGRIKANIRRRQREKQQEIDYKREAKTTYRTDAYGRNISFGPSWSSAEINERLKKIRKEKECQDVASSVPTSTHVVPIVKPTKTKSWLVMMKQFLGLEKTKGN